MRCFEVKSAEATTEHRPFGALDSKSLPAPVLDRLRATLAANAKRGLGEAEGDGLFLRSLAHSRRT